MNLCTISIWTMTVSVIGLFSIIALNRASLSTIEWPQKWPRQEAEEAAQWSEIFCDGAFIKYLDFQVYSSPKTANRAEPGKLQFWS